MYNLEQHPNVSNVDMSIQLQINCMRIVFLNWFVSSMLVRIYFTSACLWLRLCYTGIKSHNVGHNLSIGIGSVVTA